MIPALLSLIFAAGSLAYALYMLNQLIVLQYCDHYHVWEADGRPAGVFWRAPESRWTSGGIARERLSLRWLFVTPDWARHSKEAGHLLFNMRIALLGSNVLVLSTIVAFIG